MENSLSMNSEQSLETYRTLAAMSERMLIAAQENEWDQLIMLEQQYRELANTLMHNNESESLMDSDQDLARKKAEIIQQILINDDSIKALAQAWKIQLQDLLETCARSRNLQLAYQSGDS